MRGELDIIYTHQERDIKAYVTYDYYAEEKDVLMGYNQGTPGIPEFIELISVIVDGKDILPAVSCEEYKSIEKATWKKREIESDKYND